MKKIEHRSSKKETKARASSMEMKPRAAFLMPTEEDPWSPKLAAHVAADRKIALDRIITAVGAKPLRLDIDALAVDIGKAAAEVHHKVDWLEGSKAQTRLKEVRRIRKQMAKLAKLIRADSWIATIEGGRKGVVLSPIEKLLFELGRMERSLIWLSEEWRGKADLPDVLKKRRPSEMEWLAGVGLPLLYEKHFGSDAGTKASRPLISFIKATIKEFGPAYSEESIHRALTRLGSLRDRARSQPQGGKIRKK